MRIRFVLVFLTIFSLFPGYGIAQEAGIIPGDILVMLTPDGSAHAIAEDLRTLEGVATALRVDHEASAPMRVWLLKFDHTAVPQERMLQAIKQHPHVMMAQNDHPVTFRNIPNDPQYGDQWHHQNIQSEEAWGISTGGVTATGDTIVVCIIEGANMLHPDLIDNRWLNHAEIPGNGIDDDGNGYIDDHLGWNPGGNNDVVYNGNHGTNVAGMIGAKGNNSVGMTGANWDVKMMVVTVGNLSQANVIASYTYPLVMRRQYNETNGAKGAFVVATNASWGIDNGNPASYPLWCAMYDTLGTAGILNCGATANNNVNVDVVGDLPTGCASDFMVSVTATNIDDIRTFSGWGATTIDVGAPGSGVFTTSGANGYTSTSGTSFASPLTAGVIGLLYSAPCPTLMSLAHSDPMAGAMYVRQMLFEGVDLVGNLPGNTVTGGRINAGTSMNLLMSQCGACPAPTAPLTEPTPDHDVVLSWNSFTDGPYIVRYRPLGDTEWTVVDGVDDENYTASGLSPCATYEFEVGTFCEEEEEINFSIIAIYEPMQGVQPEVTASGALLFCEGESITLTSSSSWNNTWNTGSQETAIAVTETGTYTVTVSGPCDALVSNEVEVIVLDPVVPITDSFVLLPGFGSATLEAIGDSIVWYDAPEGGNIVGFGAAWETPVLTSGTTYWCTNILTNDLTPDFGGPEDRSTSGAYHENTVYYPLFTANEAFVIRSVKVFANGAANRTIGLVNIATGNTVIQGTFMIPDGESRVELNFTVPGAGQYGLRAFGGGNPQLWRDGLGSAQSYPYPLGEYGAITSSNITGANATAFYYFFYDWEVGPVPIICESERVEVLVDMTVGLQELSGAISVNVHPNPANDQLFIELAGTDLQRSAVRILDNTGRQVALHSMEGERSVINTRALAAGLYIYSIMGSGEEIARGRFVVAH